jgi:ABC-type Fe3+-hydroxamate transport system substrate-binding protein
MRLIEDALERRLEIPERPSRIVSLVPSVTELVHDLGAGGRVVGVSRYCTEPAGRLDGAARVGGQKDPDLDAVCALAPDLVLAVKEENLRRDVEALEARGVAVYVADVRTVEDGLALVGEVADLVGAEASAADAVSRAARAGIDEARAIAASHAPVPIFCPIWRDPWLTVGADTYIYDVLRLCGARPVPPGSRGDRRYPKVTLDEVRAAGPVLALLPDEPYAFGAADVAELASFVRAEAVDGKLLGWYGRRIAGIVELAKRIDAAARGSGADARRE